MPRGVHDVWTGATNEWMYITKIDQDPDNQIKILTYNETEQLVTTGIVNNATLTTKLIDHTDE